MKRVLQILALSVALAAGSFWLASGAHGGWTKTSIPVRTLDDVTGIEGITYKRQFIPGLDFLGCALLGTGILAGASLLFRRTTQRQQQSSKI